MVLAHSNKIVHEYLHRFQWALVSQWLVLFWNRSHSLLVLHLKVSDGRCFSQGTMWWHSLVLLQVNVCQVGYGFS